MKSYLAAGLLLVSLATPAFAAEQHYAVEDTVGNCSVIDARPSPTKISGLTLLGNKNGYDITAAAEKALSSGAGCQGSTNAQPRLGIPLLLRSGFSGPVQPVAPPQASLRRDSRARAGNGRIPRLRASGA
jgi:hypothetical protein